MQEISTEQLSKQVHRQAISAPLTEMASLLQEILSRRLTAYIAGVQDGKTVTRWASGEVGEIRDLRLRTAYEILLLLLTFESPLTIRAWFIGMNPELDDVSPADALRAGNQRDALQAAWAFSAGV